MYGSIFLHNKEEHKPKIVRVAKYRWVQRLIFLHIKKEKQPKSLGVGAFRLFIFLHIKEDNEVKCLRVVAWPNREDFVLLQNGTRLRSAYRQRQK